jgi:hypothetical protein
MPSPGGQASGMPGHKDRCGEAWAAKVWHPAGLPQGLPHNSPGAEPLDARTGFVEGCPWAAVWSGCARPTGCHPSPTCKICDPTFPLRSLVVKHLTENQVLGGVHTADQSPRPRSALPYINWYINGYGPPWTSSDPNPR